MEKVQGDADEWRAVLGDALKHVTTIIDFVPFNAKFATREEQGKVKESIAEFLEMLGEHQAHTPLIQITHTTRASDIKRSTAHLASVMSTVQGNHMYVRCNTVYPMALRYFEGGRQQRCVQFFI